VIEPLSVLGVECKDLGGGIGSYNTGTFGYEDGISPWMRRVAAEGNQKNGDNSPCY
jgi:hypothetical protein